jgi:hypothetical protein
MNTLILDNTLTSKKNTVKKMGKFNKAAIALTIVFSSIFSMNASAADTASIESEVSAIIVSQSKQVLTELSNELQQSIDNEIKAMTKKLFNNHVVSSLPEGDEKNQDQKEAIAKVKH